MKTKLMAMILLLGASVPAQALTFDHARITTGNYTFLAVWCGDLPDPVIVPWSGPGPLGSPIPGDAIDSPDHLRVTYVATNGMVVEVYVDCSKRNTDECLAVFKRRVESITKWLPIDEVATQKWREAQKQ